MWRFVRAIGIALLAYLFVVGSRYLSWAAMERYGFHWWFSSPWNFASISTAFIDAIARGIRQTFAIQLVLIVLWRNPRSKDAIHYGILPLFAVSFLAIQASVFVLNWIDMGSADHSSILVLEFLSSFTVIPAIFISFYALRPFIDPQICRAKETVSEDNIVRQHDRPRGWTIMGMMIVTTCFALMTASSIQWQQMMEEMAKAGVPDVFSGNIVALEIYQLIANINHALIVILVAALVLVVPNHPESSRKIIKTGIRRGIYALVVLKLVMGFVFNMAVSDQFSFDSYRAVSIAFDFGGLLGLTFANVWFFKQWKGAGCNLRIATSKWLPFSNLNAG